MPAPIPAALRNLLPPRQPTTLGLLLLAACSRPLPQADPGKVDTLSSELASGGGTESTTVSNDSPSKAATDSSSTETTAGGAPSPTAEQSTLSEKEAPSPQPPISYAVTEPQPTSRASHGSGGALRAEASAVSAAPHTVRRRLAKRRGTSPPHHQLLSSPLTGMALPAPRRPMVGPNPPPTSQERYAPSEETPFSRAKESPLSTFSIDVDTASYANVRRFVSGGQLPPVGAVRIEELLNYFPYDYPEPEGDAPFHVNLELSSAPWNEAHQLLQVGLQSKRLDASQLPPRNLVFLLDVSGSMSAHNKLPLLQRSLATLAETLRPQDQIAIAVYAGASGLVLEPTPGNQQARILRSIDRLHAGGSTNGAAGIALAYDTAARMAHPGSSTRVILATDGDFNVGMTSDSELHRLIERKRETGVFLSVLGLGMGNYQDATLELLADKGNGNYAYIDSLAEARKILVKEGGATLTTLAKDVKIQIEFNPARVEGYRLIGYENRRLAARDFNDDTKDAGELGAGHSVTALYEIVPAGTPLNGPSIDPLQYQPARPAADSNVDRSGELATIKLRYKAPMETVSRLLTQTVDSHSLRLTQTSDRFRFAAAVAAFGMTLSDSPLRGRASLALAQNLAAGALGADPNGYRAEFQRLVDKASSLRPHSEHHGQLALPPSDF